MFVGLVRVSNVRSITYYANHGALRKTLCVQSTMPIPLPS